jgi:hypothetical protein
MKNDPVENLRIVNEDIDVDRVFVCVREHTYRKNYVLGHRYKILSKTQYAQASAIDGAPKYVYTMEAEKGHEPTEYTALLLRTLRYKTEYSVNAPAFVPLRKLDPETEFMLRLSGEI